MARIICTVTDETEEALKELADGRPIATLVREAIQDYLTKHGKEVKGEVSWGGYREREEKDDE